MTAIITRFIGPSDTRGSRISAATTTNKPSTGKPERRVVPYDHALSIYANHKRAAVACAIYAGLAGEWHAGSTENGYVFVRINTGGVFRTVYDGGRTTEQE